MTSRDLLAHVGQEVIPRVDIREVQVADVMTAPPASAKAGTSLEDAVAVMVSRNVRHLPIVDARQRLVGMLSDRDVRAKVGDPLIALREAWFGPATRLKVDDLMTREPIVVRADQRT